MEILASFDLVLKIQSVDVHIDFSFFIIMIPLGPALIGCIWKILHVVWLEIIEEVCK